MHRAVLSIRPTDGRGHGRVVRFACSKPRDRRIRSAADYQARAARARGETRATPGSSTWRSAEATRASTMSRARRGRRHQRSLRPSPRPRKIDASTDTGPRSTRPRTTPLVRCVEVEDVMRERRGRILGARCAMHEGDRTERRFADRSSGRSYRRPIRDRQTPARPPPASAGRGDVDDPSPAGRDRPRPPGRFPNSPPDPRSTVPPSPCPTTSAHGPQWTRRHAHQPVLRAQLGVPA